MALFSSGNRALKTHGHEAGETCPWCDQPITHDKFEDIRRRMLAEQEQQMAALARQHEQERLTAERKAKVALEQARAEAATVADLKVAAARTEAMQSAEAAMAGRLTQMQAQLAEADAAKRTAAAQVAALQAEQAAEVARRVAEAQEGLVRQTEDLQREKESAVLAEKAKVLKLQSDLADLQRKLEGKSANELGEGSEIDLFEQLRATFEGDRIQRVPKGVNGADVVHEVVHNGRVCGKIIYDAKNRDAWQNGFAAKLKADKLAQGADFAILSSNRFPRDKAHVHNQDGVIVASPARVLAIVEILRDQLVRMLELRVSNEARGTKMEEIYAFVTSEHCRQLIEQVEAQAGKMLELDSKEQESHRRLWDQRRKLINAVQKARSDLAFEIDRIIGTAGNGPADDEAAA